MTVNTSVISLLSQISGPADLKALSERAIDVLAGEIRSELIASVSRTGGHLGPNLGMVELTIALHRVFDSPRDAIIFDTGHQSYVHKMLTGRAAAMDGLRQARGLSGYPSRAESVHDVVENSHASTALSYADGLAKAIAVRRERGRCVVAVVGDGALTGGMCWEALNNIGAAPERPMVIVLNDNGRSYAPTVGGLAQHLADLRAGGSTPELFTGLGLAYLGPIDGHDVPALEQALRRARDCGRPTVVHCVTEKGRGYRPAETDEADRMHTIAASTAGGPGRSWTAVFGEELLAIGVEREDVVAVTAAMLRPTGLYPFAKRFPGRVYDVGIAEQHAVASAAGLATGGLHPVVAVYATFLNRALDQVLMDVALHRLPVTFVLDRAGITGTDGPSHHGMWDLSLLGAVPGMRVAAPRDAVRLRELLREAVADVDGPTALRFPKAEVGTDIASIGRLGNGDVLFARDRADVLLVAVGPMGQIAVEAAVELDRAGISSSVVDPRWVLPVEESLVAFAGRQRLVVTLEDNGVAGGFGDTFCRALRTAGVAVDVQTLGLPQRFLPHGERSSILAEHGLEASTVVASVLARLAGRSGLRSLG
ncbi:MAG: 1-deoxy-D-xylulose-5-phosphate synthase [Pseudonocardiales bacterium]|nr:1-deoxy-D-xylulose-5-phosphate synthase [Pseudonocardiales bacterium]